MIHTLGWSLLPGEIHEILCQFIILGCVSALLLSVAKGGFGGSMGLLSVPVMIYACGGNTQLAIGVTLPLLIACDYVAMVSWWRKWDLRAVLLLLPGAVLGVALGAATLWALLRLGGSAGAGASDRANAALRLGIGLIAIGFVILQAIRALRRRSLAFRPVFWQGTAVGTAAGYTSTLTHAAGPIVSMYMLSQQMPKGTFVATTVLYYWIGNQLKLLPYIILGLINTDTMGASLLLVPAVVAGTLLGIFLHGRIEQKHFTAIVYVLLTFAGGDLIIKALGKLWP